MFRRITRAERERRAAKAELDSTMQAMRAVDSAFREAQDPFSIEQLTYQHAALMCRCRALLRLLRPLGEHPANLCQAVFFAALHGTLTEKCYALGMGLIFGWAAEQTDSPAPGVVLHILNNGLVLARALAERGMG